MKITAYMHFNRDRNNMTYEQQAKRMLPPGEEMFVDENERQRALERRQKIGDEIVSAYRAVEKQRRADIDAFVGSSAYRKRCVAAAEAAAAFSSVVRDLIEIESSVVLPKPESAFPGIAGFDSREPASPLRGLLAQAVEHGLLKPEALPVELERASAPEGLEAFEDQLADGDEAAQPLHRQFFQQRRASRMR